MPRSPLWHAFIGVVISAIGSAVYALTTLAWQRLVSPVSVEPSFWYHNISLPPWAFVVSHVVVAVIVYTASLAQRSHSHLGRQTVMQANVELLKQRKRVSPESGVICSTRFTHWPTNEASVPRTAFRQELDDAITKEGREVRRLWNINSPYDAERLGTIIDRYKGFSGVSIRVLFDIPDYVIPELLIVNDKLGSISLPQTRNPQGIESTVAFTDARSITILRQYFDILWDRADKALDSGEVVGVVLKRVQTRKGSA
jgi:hypothetical protein